MTGKNTIEKRIYYVDGLRGVAAIMVAWFHLYTASQEFYLIKKLQVDSMGSILNHIAVIGRWGVRLFFIISGFVISYSLQNTRHLQKISSVGWYMLRRSIRLDPTYWCSLALALFCGFIVGFTHFSPHIFPITSAGQLFTNMIYLFPFFNHHYILSVSWTLSLEIQFYLFFALLIFLGNRVGNFLSVNADTINFIFITIFFLFSILFISHISVDSSGFFFPYLHMFLAGVILFQAYHSKKYLILLVFMNIIFLFLFGKFKDLSILTLMLSQLIFFIGSKVNFIKYILESRLLLFLGKLSYSIYLLHVSVGLIVIYFIANNKIINNHTIFLLIVFAGLVGTILVSALLYHFVEKQTIKISKKIKF